MGLPRLDGLSLPELHELRDLVDAAIVQKQDETAAELLERMKKEAEAAGLSFDQVLAKDGAASRRRRKRAQPKYKNPDNPKQTWSGQGKQPEWIDTLLAKGKTLEQLAI